MHNVIAHHPPPYAQPSSTCPTLANPKVLDTALQQLKLQCVISIIFLLNPKDSTYQPL